MSFKRIEELDHYEILNLARDASPEDISAATRAALSAYQPDSLASYGLVSEEERRMMLERIENAHRILMDTETRRSYDEKTLPAGYAAPPRALFRKTVTRLEIQDGEERVGIFGRIRNLFRSS